MNNEKWKTLGYPTIHPSQNPTQYLKVLVLTLGCPQKIKEHEIPEPVRREILVKGTWIVAS